MSCCQAGKIGMKVLKSFFYFRQNKRMALEPRKLWVTRLKESTSIDVIRDTFSTNASKVLKVTMVSGGSACLVFASEDGKL